jgi:hypothetical protein
MRFVLILALLIVLYCPYASSRWAWHEFDSTASTLPSVPQGRGSFKTVGTVAGQVCVGLLTGLGGLMLSQIHPVVGGVGWIVGSSYGVYSIGDEGTGRGNFWWTAAAGTGTVLAFAAGLPQHTGIDAVIFFGIAAVTSLAAEIVVYFITEGSMTAQPSVSVVFTNSRVVCRTCMQGSPSLQECLTPSLVLSITF